MELSKAFNTSKHELHIATLSAYVFANKSSKLIHFYPTNSLQSKQHRQTKLLVNEQNYYKVCLKNHFQAPFFSIFI